MARLFACGTSAALLLYAVATGCVPAQEGPAGPSNPGTMSGTGGRAAGSGGSGGSSTTPGSGGAPMATGGAPNTGGVTPAGTGGAGGTPPSTGTGGAGGRGGTEPDANPTAPDTGMVSAAPKLSTDVFPIVKANCARAGCHDPVKHEHGMNLSTVEMVHSLWVGVQTNDHCKNNASVARVTAGKPEMSFVVTLIKNDATRCAAQRRMPPAPLPPLSAADVKTISDWIAAGAKKD